jgi:hypothetical protein
LLESVIVRELKNENTSVADHFPAKKNAFRCSYSKGVLENVIWTKITMYFMGIGEKAAQTIILFWQPPHFNVDLDGVWAARVWFYSKKYTQQN